MATTALPDFLNLDWRKCPPPVHLLQLLDELMTLIDSKSAISMILSSSRAKRLVDPATSTLGHPMILQSPRLTLKSASTTSAKASGDYISRLVSLILFVMSKLDERQVAYKRATFYELQAGKFTTSQLEQGITDLGLTLGLHPACFGLMHESKSVVRAPAGVTLRVDEVTRIHEWARDKTQGRRTVRMEGGHPVQVPVLPLRVFRIEGTIRAVVVSEHRNAQQIVDSYEDQVGFDGILQVMVGGYADAAAREFLHLLSVHDDLADAKVLFVSDCDPHGLAIYSNLKYGSLACAHASPSMTCPQLVWAGLAMSDWKSFAGTYAQRQLDAHLRIEPNMTAGDQQTLLQRQQAKSTALVAYILSGKAAKLDSKSLERVNGLTKLGVFKSQEETFVRTELERMREEKTILSLWDLNHFGNHGVAYFVRDTVAAARQEQDNLPANAFHEMSQDRSRWVAHGHRTMSNSEVDMEIIREAVARPSIQPTPAHMARAFDDAEI